MITPFISVILYLFMGLMMIIACYKDIKNKETSKTFNSILEWSQFAVLFSLFGMVIEFLIRYIWRM